MGGLGSGRYLEREPRRLVERAFALDIKQVLTTRLVPGTQGEIDLWARLVAWPVHVTFLIRRAEGFVATLWFNSYLGGGLVHLPIDVPPRGSHRRRYFVCPRPDHGAKTPVLVARLYWPLGDPRGFACRACHKLTYRSQQSRREEPLWLQRLSIEATQWWAGQ